MTTQRIKDSVENVIRFYTENPDKAKDPGRTLKAVMKEGLCCQVEKSDGTIILKTDMPKGIGGDGSANTPGTLFRAALVSCDATLVTLRAAYLGIKLTTLELSVSGDPDDEGTLGFLGIDDTISAGERGLRLHFSIGAENASPEQLRELIDWVEAHSPVGNSVCQVVPIETKVDIV